MMCLRYVYVCNIFIFSAYCNNTNIKEQIHISLNIKFGTFLKIADNFLNVNIQCKSFRETHFRPLKCC